MRLKNCIECERIHCVKVTYPYSRSLYRLVLISLISF
uniref:Uncharacterized protein n=1 Tax=Myoviridae sp. ctNQV2 TaxID=2827683 RepID=A0A8S5RZP4_9CAUD|nr:MAG TPA: hypothetical protein [Myoviridae sp. ctNQV2]